MHTYNTQNSKYNVKFKLLRHFNLSNRKKKGFLYGVIKVALGCIPHIGHTEMLCKVVNMFNLEVDNC